MSLRELVPERMLCRWLLFALVGSRTMFPSWGQDSMRCADQARLRPRTDRICEELLPPDAKVWYARKEGGACSCECEKLANKTVKELTALRKARGQRYKKNISQFVKYNKDKKVRGGPRPMSGDTMEADRPGFLIEGELTCDRDHLLGDVLGDIEACHLTYEEVMEQFTFRYHTDGTGSAYCQERFPNIGGWGSRAVINIPSTFVRHPAVGRELTTFMLFHEMAHAMRFELEAGNICVDLPGVCEPNVDVWAAETGMRAVFVGASYADAMTAVTDQLRAYYAAIYPPAVRDLPFVEDPDCCINKYPKLTCRAGLIAEASSSTATEPMTASVIAEYLATGSCFADGVRSTTYIGAPLCGSECGGEPIYETPEEVEEEDGDTSGISEGIVRILEFQRALAKAMRQRAIRLDSSYCEKYPDHCRAPWPWPKDGFNLALPWRMRIHTARLEEALRIMQRVDKDMRRAESELHQ